MKWRYGNNVRGGTYTCTKVLIGTEKNLLAHGTGHKDKSNRNREKDVW